MKPSFVASSVKSTRGKKGRKKGFLAEFLFAIRDAAENVENKPFLGKELPKYQFSDILERPACRRGRDGQFNMVGYTKISTNLF